MFNKKEMQFSDGECAFLDSIYNLILNTEISSEEREVLNQSKIELEKYGNTPKIINDLMNRFRLGAIQRNLSKPVSDFYAKLYSSHGAVGNLKKGIGLSTALLPIWKV